MAETSKYRRAVLASLRWVVSALLAGAVSVAVLAQVPGAIDLTREAKWEYRLVADGHDGPWVAKLVDAAASVSLAKSDVTWPRTWATFAAWDDGSTLNGPNDDPASFTQMPTALTLNGVSACRATLPTDERGTLDISWGHGEPAVGRWAYAFAKVEMVAEQTIMVAAAADGPMTWWVDGKPVFATPKALPPIVHVGGLLGYAFPLTLDKGPHVLAVRVESGTGEWRLTTSAAPAPWPSERVLQARCSFTVDDPTAFVSLTFTGPDIDHTALNIVPLYLSLPMPRQYYTQALGLAPTLLRQGRNEITKAWPAEDVDRLLVPAPDVRVEGSLVGLTPAGVDIISGAIIVQATEKSLTIMCRTNARVPCVLKIDGRELRSEPGLIHRFLVDGLQPATAYPYSVAPDNTGIAPTATKSAIARTFATTGPLTVAVSGDPQGGVVTFLKVVGQLGEELPDLVLLCGDMVGDGLVESYWESQLFGPLNPLASTVPIYAVRGNHDRRAPMFDRFFAESRGGRNWAQEIAGVLLIGLDGQYDWRSGGANVRWLEATLAASKARFIFVASHYPAYSSTTHGRLNDDGRINDPAGRAARDFLYPLMIKYRVTAYLTGHDHGYERSEPPGGVTSITASGAGANPYALSNDPKQNPYSVVQVRTNHHCLLKINGDTCTLTAIGVDGKVLDTKTWLAR